MANTQKPSDTSLYTTDLFAGYGSQTIIKGVTIQVDQGKIISLLGPNGAGKSTLLRLSVGL